MTNVRSWQFWAIVALALTTLACASKAERRERKEEARELRRERAEQKRQERAERNQQRRAEPVQAQAATPAVTTAATPAATLTPVSTAPVAAAADAKVVFMRVTNAGGNVAASIFDVTGSGEPKFIGIVRPFNKLVYPVRQGQYTFMVVSDAADFMQATVIGGKTYYTLITPRADASKTRFSFKPVRGDELDGSQFSGWDRSTRTVTNTPTTLAWAQQNAANVADKRDRWWPEWSSKSEAQRASQSLNAEDGR